MNRLRPTRRPCRTSAITLLVCAFALLAAGACGPRGRAVPVAETTLVLGVAQPASDNQPDRSLSRVSALLGRASLLRLDRTCRVRPGLASSATPSSDGLTWTIALDAGLRFHDGSALDAEAVATLLAPGDPAFEPPGLRDIASVTTSGPHTLQVTLRAPSSLLSEALASLEVTGGADGTSAAGPFVPVAGAPGKGIEMAAFDAHHGGRPAIDRLVLRSFPTARTAWAALMRREIDFLYEVSPEALGFVASSADAQVRSFLRSYVYAVGFNVSHPALRSPDFRRRLAASVDRRVLIDDVFGGRGVAALDPVWPLHWAHDAPLTPEEEVAKLALPRRLGAAPPLMPRPAAGSRLTLRCLVPAGVPLFERLALHVQRAMLEAGVDLQLEPVPLAEMSRRLAQGDFDTYLLEMNGFGLGWTYWLWHSEASRPFVASGYRGADEALDALRRAGSDAAVRERLRAVRARLQEDPPAIFLCWPLTARAVTTRFALPTGEDHDILTSLDRWVAVAEEP